MTIKDLKLKTLLALFVFLLPMRLAFAADITFDAGGDELGVVVGQVLEVGVFIDTEGENVNAIEGKILFPSDLLEVKKINEGGSVINFWIEKLVVESGQIAFSGIVPHGYSGVHGMISSVTFLVKKSGSGTINFGDFRVLLNDGKGTAVVTKTHDLSFVVSESVVEEKGVLILGTQETQIETDGDSPEDFVPEVAKDSNVFDGKWFLIFATQDKGSGVDSYEVSEGDENFIPAGSPYLLRNQNLDTEITVKAVDKNGNERTVYLPAQYLRGWYYVVFVVFVVVVSICFIWKFLWRKRKKGKK